MVNWTTLWYGTCNPCDLTCADGLGLKTPLMILLSMACGMFIMYMLKDKIKGS